MMKWISRMIPAVLSARKSAADCRLAAALARYDKSSETLTKSALDLVEESVADQQDLSRGYLRVVEDLVDVMSKKSREKTAK